jgi:sarcosine oxidase subunit gamma
MSDPVTPLGNATFDGFARVAEIGPLGMVTLRAKPDTDGLAKAVKAATGCALPGQRRIVGKDDRAAAWMSPDEYLLILPRAAVGKALADIAKTLKGQHHLAAEVSDARAVFEVTGARADQVLAKLCPVDLAALPEGEMRRTRLAQIACALWRVEGGLRVVTFRSVAAYAFGVLRHAAMPGSELDC